VGSHTGKAGLVTYLTRYAPVLRHMIFISSHEESTSALRLQEGSAFSAQEYTPFFAVVIFLYAFFDFVLL
jgi:hypothetical protein